MTSVLLRMSPTPRILLTVKIRHVSRHVRGKGTVALALKRTDVSETVPNCLSEGEIL